MTAALTACLAGCAGIASDTRLRWWAMSQEGENAPSLLPPFERATGIAVEVQAIPWTAAHEKVLTAFAGGSLPDVLMVANDWLAELTLLGAIAPVPKAMTIATDVFPGAAAAVTIDGTPRAVPWVTDAWFQYFRRDLVGAAGYASPPDRWNDWKQMAHALKRRRPDKWVTLQLLDWPEPLFGYASDQPDSLLRDRNTRGNFSTPGFRAALAFYKSIFDEGLSPPFLGTEAGNTLAAFSRGDYAILPSNAETVGDFHRLTKMTDASWGIAATPGSGGPARTMATGSSLVVSHTARDPARAWRLVAYLAGTFALARLNSITGDLPARRGPWRTAALARDPLTPLLSAGIANAVAPIAIPESARLREQVQIVAEQMVRGVYTVEAATREMDTRVDHILEKRRALVDKGIIT